MLSLQRCTRWTRSCISPPLRTTFSHLSALALYPVPGAAIVLGGSGGECDPSGEVATLLVLVIALLSRNCGEPRTSPTPSKQKIVRTDNTSCLPPDLVVALQSWMCPMPPVTSLLSQWHAFLKLFLKLSERKAYSTGLMAELEYWRQSESRITITRVLLWLKPGSWLKLNPD